MKSKVLTIPNFITLARFAGIFVFVWLLFGVDSRLAACLVLGGLGATDWVDGFVARKLNQESSLGRIMDPTVDRLLLLVVIPSLLIDGSIYFLIGILALVRESLIVLAVLVLASMKVDAIRVNWYGKTGVFALFFAFPLFLLSQSGVSAWIERTAEISAFVLGIAGLIMSYIALGLYIPVVKEQLQKR